MPQLKNANLLLLLTIVCTLLSGCDRTYVADEGSSKTEESQSTLPSQDKPQTSSVSADKLTNVASPATASALVSEDATPEGVCRKFMALIKSEKRVEAENLLTRMALAVTTKAGLQLEPMGGPNSVYTVNDVRYATNKKRLAQVECCVADNIDGEKVKMDLTWLVRKQSNGWRISGVMLEMTPGSEKDLLSFENIHDVTKIKSLADADVLNEDSRQANASGATLK